MPRFPILAAVALFSLLPGMAAAQIAGSDVHKACVGEQIAANAPVADCVNRAQTACFDLGAAPAAATLCFQNAKQSWGEMITERMQEISATADENITAVAGIEVKYDLMLNLLQCDRMAELAQLTEGEAEARQAQRARCEATATGLAYVKLLLQSRNIE